MAWLKSQFGRDRLVSAPVVLPIRDFFPDAYDGSEATVRTLFDRVCGYMGVKPEQIEISLYAEQVPVFDGNIVPGTGGLYEEGEGKYRIWLNESNLDDPGGLIATMAHEVGHVLLLGERRISPDEGDHEPLTDLLTVFLGLGVMMSNSVVHESSWTSGTASGWSIGRRGYMTMPMYGYALALFARERSETNPEWAKVLRLDVRHAFQQGQKWLEDPENEPSSSASAKVVAGPVITEPATSNEAAPTDVVSPDHAPRCAFWWRRDGLARDVCGLDLQCVPGIGRGKPGRVDRKGEAGGVAPSRSVDCLCDWRRCCRPADNPPCRVVNTHRRADVILAVAVVTWKRDKTSRRSATVVTHWQSKLQREQVTRFRDG